MHHFGAFFKNINLNHNPTKAQSKPNLVFLATNDHFGHLSSSKHSSPSSSSSLYCFSTSSPPPRSSRRPSVVRCWLKSQTISTGAVLVLRDGGAVSPRWRNELSRRHDHPYDRSLRRWGTRLLPLSRRFVPEPVQMSYIVTDGIYCLWATLPGAFRDNHDVIRQTFEVFR